MPGELHEISLRGSTLRRGFWLYAWEVTTANGDVVVYVGRTGDNSSPNAQSPFNRMGQHLGNSDASNTLRKHLIRRGIDPAACDLRLVAYGPILDEAPDHDMDEHKIRRNVVGALEKRLADELTAAGYDVLNPVRCRWELDDALWADVLAVFAGEFPRLAAA